MPDNTLDLLIRTKADLKAAKDAQAALEKQIQSAKYLGKGYAEQEAQLKKLTQSINEYVSKNPGAASEKWLSNMKGLGTAVNEVSAQLFGLGGIGRLIFNPILLSVILAVQAFNKAREALKEWNAELDKTAEEVAKPTFLEGIKARKQVLLDAAAAAVVYRDKIDNLIDPEERYQKKIAQAIDLLHAEVKAEEDVANARFERDQSSLKDAEARENESLLKRVGFGLITLEQYNRQKLLLDLKYLDALTEAEQAHEQAKMDRDRKAREDEIKLQETALKHLEETQPARDKEATEARAKAVEAESVLVGDQGKLKGFEDQKATAEQNIKEARKIIEEEGPLGSRNPDDDASNSRAKILGSAKVARAVDTLRTNQAALAVANKGIDETNARLGPEISAAAKAEGQASRAEGRAESGITKKQEAQDALDLAKKKNEIETKAAEQVRKENQDKIYQQARSKLEGTSLGGGYTAHDAEVVGDIEQRRRTHQAITVSEAQFADGFEEYARSRGENQDRLLDAVAVLAGTQSTEKQKLATLEKLVKDLSKGGLNT